MWLDLKQIIAETLRLSLGFNQFAFFRGVPVKRHSTCKCHIPVVRDHTLFSIQPKFQPKLQPPISIIPPKPIFLLPKHDTVVTDTPGDLWPRWSPDPAFTEEHPITAMFSLSFPSQITSMSGTVNSVLLSNVSERFEFVHRLWMDRRYLHSRKRTPKNSLHYSN